MSQDGAKGCRCPRGSWREYRSRALAQECPPCFIRAADAAAVLLMDRCDLEEGVRCEFESFRGKRSGQERSQWDRQEFSPDGRGEDLVARFKWTAEYVLGTWSGCVDVDYEAIGNDEDEVYCEPRVPCDCRPAGQIDVPGGLTRFLFELDEPRRTAVEASKRAAERTSGEVQLAVECRYLGQPKEGGGGFVAASASWSPPLRFGSPRLRDTPVVFIEK